MNQSKRKEIYLLSFGWVGLSSRSNKLILLISFHSGLRQLSGDAPQQTNQTLPFQFKENKLIKERQLGLFSLSSAGCWNERNKGEEAAMKLNFV